jgi:type IV fimbrial biogenesis protein FimT
MNTPRQRAFTLVELLVTLAVLVVLLGLALPAFSKMIQQNRSEAIRNQLVSTLHAARAFAVERRQNIEVCGSSQGEECDQAWHLGWLMRGVDGEPIVLLFNRLDGAPKLKWAGLSKQIQFQANGLSSTSNGTFTLCNTQREVLWQLKLNRQGRVRSVTGTNIPDGSEAHCP